MCILSRNLLNNIRYDAHTFIEELLTKSRIEMFQYITFMLVIWSVRILGPSIMILINKSTTVQLRKKRIYILRPHAVHSEQPLGWSNR